MAETRTEVGRAASDAGAGPSIVVIGGGLAGLSAVLEAHRKFPEGNLAMKY